MGTLKRSALVLALLVCPVLAGASAFSFTDVKGQTHTLAGYQGKWVLLNLWATWCRPCLMEMPELEALSQSRRELVVLGLAVDGQDARRVLQYADKLKLSYPVIAGNEKLAQQLGAKGYPTSILYDGTGKQVLFKEGPITRQEIERLLGRDGAAH
jgi:thiol-disulfide isomerase/thioredoxin